MADIFFVVLIAAGIFFALRYIKNTPHCAHNCDECRHPCRVRS
ncbi:MAG: hypothetical protein SPL10_06910 [Synergistales bacterium]|nr:hypothetical protein [Synergistales bacterium]MDY6400967.1 hypothetical protein [Synergistales bacterium]MDY6404881.1 hypothetical protein [Synergistales bacterium]MDY6411104.1 hypothetical protein [Synergistales bacterium]MDY6414868.1 hypothetical protein [Synergistales bacterium]